MTVVIRALRPNETRTFLEVHHAAVRGIAAADYPSEVIEAWASLPITHARVEQVLANPDGEIRFAAVMGGEVVGIRAVVPARHELRACYVVPHAARKNVGSEIVAQIERTARAHRLNSLWLDSSLTAERFYLSLGYSVLEHCTHILESGYPMACIKMRKGLY